MRNSDRSNVRFGGTGHEFEYVVHLKGFGHEDYIPRSFELELQKLLPDWNVCSRGTRIEITGRQPNRHFGDRDDAEVVTALERALRKFEFDEFEVFGEQIAFGPLLVIPNIANNILEESYKRAKQNLSEEDVLRLLQEIIEVHLHACNSAGMYCEEQMSTELLALLERASATEG